MTGGQIMNFESPVDVSGLGPDGRRGRLSAAAVTLKALASRFNLVDLARFEAEVELYPLSGDREFHVRGQFSAAVVQECSVTLEPVSQIVEGDVSVLYRHRSLEPAAPDGGKAEILIDPGDDDIEYFEAGEIDLGEMLAQHLALSLNPYPRRPDSEIPAAVDAATAVDEKPSPFAILHKLKDKT